jgi:hypothetical protein
VDYVLDELTEAVRTPHPELENSRHDVWTDVLRILEYLISQCERLGGGTLLSRGFDAETKLIPLLIARRNNLELQIRVHDLYHRTCEILRHNTTKAKFVPIQLEYLSQIEQGASDESAWDRYLEAIMKVA